MTDWSVRNRSVLAPRSAAYWFYAGADAEVQMGHSREKAAREHAPRMMAVRRDATETPLKSTYSEPTVLWRLRHPDGRTAHAKIIPVGNTASAVWFIGELPEDAQDFDDWASAVKWAENLRAELETDGWAKR